MKTGNQVPRPINRERALQIKSVFLFCGAIVMLGGCAERKARAAFPWATAVLVKPIVPNMHDPSAVPAADIAPDLRIEPPSSLGKLVAVRPAPVPPRSRT